MPIFRGLPGISSGLEMPGGGGEPPGFQRRLLRQSAAATRAERTTPGLYRWLVPTGKMGRAINLYCRNRDPGTSTARQARQSNSRRRTIHAPPHLPVCASSSDWASGRMIGRIFSGSVVRISVRGLVVMEIHKPRPPTSINSPRKECVLLKPTMCMASALQRERESSPPCIRRR